MSDDFGASGGSSRRAFLGYSAAAIAGAGLAGLAHPVQGAAPVVRVVPKRPIKKGVGIGMITGVSSLMDKFKLAKDAGFEGIEIDSPGKWAMADMLAARDATGVAVCGAVDSVHWNQTLGDPNPQTRAAGLEGLRACLRDAKALGAPGVLLVPGVVNKQLNYADVYKRSQEEIRKVIPLAEELGLKIGIENVWNAFLLSPLEAARYIDEFNSPAVGWHFDVGNIINYGWPEQWIRILGKRIVKLHIKEFSRKKRDDEGMRKGFDVELLEGDNDWPAVMKALDDIGYTGWAVLEVDGGGIDRLKFLAERTNRILSA
jgi:hexulose-6-phosphate isomerase